MTLFWGCCVSSVAALKYWQCAAGIATAIPVAVTPCAAAPYLVLNSNDVDTSSLAHVVYLDCYVVIILDGAAFVDAATASERSVKKSSMHTTY